MRPEHFLRQLSIALLCTLLAACEPPPAGGLEISNARVRELLPGQDKTAAYFEATNSGANPRTITGARSDSVRAIEFHTTTMDGDIMRMRRLKEVTVEAGSTIRFEPGGHHLMLFGVRSVDDPTIITLRMADGTELPISFRRVAPGT